MTVLDQIYEYTVAGNAPKVTELTQQAIGDGLAASDILREGLIAAMDEVGERFECGDFYIPELLTAARAMKASVEILKPHLVEAHVEPVAKAVLGTVAGDLHDIGKNLVGMMLEGAGFQIVDLGIDVQPAAFVDAVKTERPDVLGLSALLTTTMRNMKSTIEALDEAGLRQRVRVIVGGAPITEEFANQIGADGFAPDAGRAVHVAKQLLGMK